MIEVQTIDGISFFVQEVRRFAPSSPRMPTMIEASQMSDEALRQLQAQCWSFDAKYRTEKPE